MLISRSWLGVDTEEASPPAPLRTERGGDRDSGNWEKRKIEMKATLKTGARVGFWIENGFGMGLGWWYLEVMMWALGWVERVGTRGERVLFVAFERGKRILSETFLEVGMANVDFLWCRKLLLFCLLGEMLSLKSYSLTVLQLYFCCFNFFYFVYIYLYIKYLYDKKKMVV